ncbi:FF domain-containing protein ASCRUDRAFT_81221 [Ascoidea rubescens DSM 1968]|uniref:FF domain-containing protein n=1 Tax=Ascoidea rubescens DSM 1968 TaxID=1344418 RepID=A0A1D2VGW5_9ASCO|nr:hypothetical protein ASCRUDRAFT_81221 [Ascoidea rubescens DSM 1968]ODV60876.1 hypothetical protein ASCRUDRAFT_81221 [Ascoidea rubescens DSM 1968]
MPPRKQQKTLIGTEHQKYASTLLAGYDSSDSSDSEDQQGEQDVDANDHGDAAEHGDSNAEDNDDDSDHDNDDGFQNVIITHNDSTGANLDFYQDEYQLERKLHAKSPVDTVNHVDSQNESEAGGQEEYRYDNEYFNDSGNDNHNESDSDIDNEFAINMDELNNFDTNYTQFDNDNKTGSSTNNININTDKNENENENNNIIINNENEFISLLHDSKLDPFKLWDTQVNLLVNDQRFYSIDSNKKRKQLFDNWSNLIIKNTSSYTTTTTANTTTITDNNNSNNDDEESKFIQFIQNNFNKNLFYVEFKRKHKKNHLFNSLNLSDNQKEKIYRNFKKNYALNKNTKNKLKLKRKREKN